MAIDYTRRFRGESAEWEQARAINDILDDLSTHGSTYVSLGAGVRRQREIAPLWQSLSQTLAPAADIPTTATTGPGGATPITSPQNIPYNSALITPIGALDVSINALGTNYLQNQVSTETGSGARAHGRSFDYYGLDLAIYFRNAVVSSSKFWVYVDGLPTTAAPVTSSAASGNSKFYFRLTWGTARWRRVTVYTELLDWGGMDVGPTDTVVASPKPTFSIFGLGDSYMAGTGATTELQSFGYTLARSLGAEFYNGGIAGTGYSVAGSFSVYGSTARMAKVASVQPDWVLFAGSINDGSIAANVVGPAASAAYSAALVAAPRARLLVQSVQANSGSMTAGNIANGTAVAASATAAGALVVSQPIAEGWITGTGHVGATTGSGNADVFIGSDGIHPTQAGHDMAARRLLVSIRAALAA